MELCVRESLTKTILKKREQYRSFTHKNEMLNLVSSVFRLMIGSVEKLLLVIFEKIFHQRVLHLANDFRIQSKRDAFLR